jgi:hypothetical protein
MMKLKRMRAARRRMSVSTQTGFAARPSNVARGLKKTPSTRLRRFMG